MKHLTKLSLSAAAIAIALTGALLPVNAQMSQAPVPDPQVARPNPPLVPSDKAGQPLVNRDNARPDNAPTDPRNSQNKDGNPNTSN